MSHALNKNNLIAVLDVGTSKTTCILAYPTNNNPKIIGAASLETTGIKKSEITSLNDVAESISKTISEVEKVTGERITNIIATACASSLQSDIIQDSLDVDGKEITENDINRLISSAQNKIPESDNEILHCIPIDYSLDKRHMIADPRGLSGEKLHIALHTIQTPFYQMQDMDTAFNKNLLNCVKKVASPYACGLACLSREEKKQGTAVIDLGAGTTGIAVFYEGQPVWTGKIPFGGEAITKMLATTFNTSLKNAERIKTWDGSCLPSVTYDKEEIKIPLIGEDENVSNIKVTKSDIVKTIEPYIDELFLKIKNTLIQKGFYDICMNFVLTGGGSQLHGINEKASLILEKNVRTGRPIHLFDKKKIIPPYTYQGYMGCLGLLYYTTEIFLKTPIPKHDRAATKNKFIRFFRFFLDNS